MAAANVVTGYDPASNQVLSMEISSSAKTMPSEDEYLDDMMRLWQRKQAKSKSASQQQRDAAAGRHSPAVQGTPARHPSGGASTSFPSSQPAKQRKWRPRQTPRLSRDDYIVVVKPRVPCELRTLVPADRAGDAIRRYLGDRTTTQIQVWPIWEQNILVCSTTIMPMAQRLLGDFQLQVGDQQLPVRGHAKAPGDTCKGVININPAESPEKIKSELHWPRGTILAVRKLGDSAAAVVTFEGTKFPRFLFYHCVATYIRPYKKTVPVCTKCGTIGHRPPECPHTAPTQCAKCGTPAPAGLTAHDCNPKCLLCHGAHETGTSGCAAKYRKRKQHSTSPRGTTSSSQPDNGTNLHQSGPPFHADTQAFPPLVAPTAVPQVSSWAGTAASKPLSPPSVDPPSPELVALRQHVAELQRQNSLLSKQLELLNKQLQPQQQCTARPSGIATPVQAATPATSKLSPRAKSTPIKPPAPAAMCTPAVGTGAASTPAALEAPGAPQVLLPANPTPPSEERAPCIEERLTRVEASINHLLTSFSVQRIVVEVTQAIQAWAITQFQPKASRSRSSSVSSAGTAPRRRRKVATTTPPSDNPASVPLPASEDSEQNMEDQI
ncbi:hypothetical protein HPB50_022628 [Hyalomma asiaticum]|uniref:Uncharacterized protein n=1 Tax=Hyalomma asiaticum TaxID=266040 RepID=A0ACB7SJN2_HYAAI|nr:hypothetical protein HPB50_022628 [Hyalomma asiaticum]